MPSPFPGMDPYLESPRLWADFHQALLYSIRAQLNQRLPEGFVASLNERVYLEALDRSYYADAAILETQAPKGSGGVLMATAPLEIRLTREEVKEPFLEVLQVRGAEESVVTVIELLSPKNKEGGSGMKEYQAKQERLLESDVNLLEIDLLRKGQEVIAVPQTLLRTRATCDYAICLHRAGNGPLFGCWPIALRGPLPTDVAVPLTAEAGDVLLDLAAAFTRVYDEGGYSRRVDYTETPFSALSESDMTWAKEILS